MKKMIFPVMNGSNMDETESMWVEPAGSGEYVLLNSPFKAFGVNYQDRVAGFEHEGSLWFVRVVTRSGRSTYRLIRVGEPALFFECWTPLEKLGCSFEEGEGIYSVDVPPGADIYRVYEVLEKGEKLGAWEFEEASVGHMLNREAN